MKKMDRLLKEWIGAFGIAVVIVVVLVWIIWPMQVEGRSMEPTLSDGDFILVSKLWFRFKTVKTGDLIVVQIKDNETKEKIVKRVIGLEGDHIVIKDGVVFVNGEALVEPYATGETTGNVDIFVPHNGYFILGDHRKISKDSRYLGCVFKKNIRGKVLFKKIY